MNLECGHCVQTTQLLVLVSSRSSRPQVITDNVANCKSAWPIITKEFPWITCGGCTAHGLNLIFKKWAKIPWVRRIVFDSTIP